MNEAETPQAPATAAGLLLPRVLGALLLRTRTYEEIADDTRAGFQAGTLIVILGVLEASVHSALHHHSEIDVTVVLEGVIAALIGWLIWTGILWVLGARAFGHEVDVRSVLRAIAFAHSPGLVYGLGVVPFVAPWSGLLYAVTILWFFGTLFAAVQGVFRVRPGRALQILASAALCQILLREVVPYAFRLVPGL